MSELRVRRAEPRDIDGILKLLEQVNLVHVKGRPDLFNRAVKYSREDLEKMIEDDKDPIFVCVGDEVLGHAFCVDIRIGNAVLKEVRTLYIDDICVDENARGQGVGKALYDHVEEYARAEGYYNITLNVWAFNEGAKAFYEKCGMAPQKYGMEKVL